MPFPIFLKLLTQVCSHKYKQVQAVKGNTTVTGSIGKDRFYSVTYCCSQEKKRLWSQHMFVGMTGVLAENEETGASSGPSETEKWNATKPKKGGSAYVKPSVLVNRHTWKLGPYLPTDARDRHPLFRCWLELIHSFGSLEFSQAGTLVGTGIILEMWSWAVGD